jgi:hypothetical protein
MKLPPVETSLMASPTAPAVIFPLSVRSPIVILPALVTEVLPAVDVILPARSTFPVAVILISFPDLIMSVPTP